MALITVDQKLCVGQARCEFHVQKLYEKAWNVGKAFEDYTRWLVFVAEVLDLIDRKLESVVAIVVQQNTRVRAPRYFVELSLYCGNLYVELNLAHHHGSADALVVGTIQLIPGVHLLAYHHLEVEVQVNRLLLLFQAEQNIVEHVKAVFRRATERGFRPRALRRDVVRENSVQKDLVLYRVQKVHLLWNLQLLPLQVHLADTVESRLLLWEVHLGYTNSVLVDWEDCYHGRVCDARHVILVLNSVVLVVCPDHETPVSGRKVCPL